MNIRKKILFFLLNIIVLFAYGLENDKKIIQTQQADKTDLAVDLIIFSYDRPMQIYAYLESIKKYISGLNQIYVLYRTSHVAYEQAYKRIQQEYSNVYFVNQDAMPRKTFKEHVLNLVFTQSQAPYVMFGVDDIIVTDYINIQECVSVLKEQNAYGFYLRLGKNIRQWYNQYIDQDLPLPAFTKIKKNICAWNFKDGEGTWGLPISVDMTIYKKQDLQTIIPSLHFQAPNSFEGEWAMACTGFVRRHKIGLCYEHSKIVNIPLNLVQKEGKSRNMQAFSPQKLLKLFNQGVKIDIRSLFQVPNKSTHMEFEVTFMKEPSH